jgi:hypothetical protein
MSVIPNAVGRIDAITEAIRDGDRERAIELVGAEQKRLAQKYHAIASELDKCREACSQVSDFEIAIRIDKCWHKARKACGWSGVPGFEGPVEKLPPVKPALRAEELPIGTVMVLGCANRTLSEKSEQPKSLWFDSDSPSYCCCITSEFTISEIQELIVRGVEFRLPEGCDS